MNRICLRPLPIKRGAQSGIDESRHLLGKQQHTVVLLYFGQTLKQVSLRSEVLLQNQILMQVFLFLICVNINLADSEKKKC